MPSSAPSVFVATARPYLTWRAPRPTAAFRGFLPRTTLVGHSEKRTSVTVRRDTLSAPESALLSTLAPVDRAAAAPVAALAVALATGLWYASARARASVPLPCGGGEGRKFAMRVAHRPSLRSGWTGVWPIPTYLLYHRCKAERYLFPGPPPGGRSCSYSWATCTQWRSTLRLRMLSRLSALWATRHGGRGC